MRFDQNKVFQYKLDTSSASIFGSDIAEIEWNILDDGEIRINQFINNEYHTPIMDYEHFYNCNRELYIEVVEYIKENFVNDK